MLVGWVISNSGQAFSFSIKPLPEPIPILIVNCALSCKLLSNLNHSIHGLVLERRSSSALAMELRFSCNKPIDMKSCFHKKNHL